MYNLYLFLILCKTINTSSKDNYYHFSGFEFLKNYTNLSVSGRNWIWSQNNSIKSDYSIRDYLSDIRNITNVKGNFYINESSFYHPQGELNASIIRYNNLYRYGRNENERFMSVFIVGDPWNPIMHEDFFPIIAFVGFELEINREINYFCQFRHPVKIKVDVNVERLFLKDDRLYCPIPSNVIKVF